MMDVAKSASQGPQITTGSRQADNVYGVFTTLAEARKAMEALGRAGIEGQHITMQGDAPDEAAIRTDTAGADSRMMRRWSGIVAVWAALGALAGAALGVSLGWLMIDSLGNATFGSVALTSLLGALFGGIAGGLVGSMYSAYDTEP